MSTSRPSRVRNTRSLPSTDRAMERLSDTGTRSILFLLILAFAAYILTAVGGVVKIVVISSLIAYILDPVAVAFEARGTSRRSATIIIFLSIMTVIAAFLVLILPIMSREAAAVQASLASGGATAAIRQAETLMKQAFPFVTGDLDLASRLTSAASGFADWMADHILDVVSIMTNLVIIPFFVFFFLKDGRGMKRDFIRIVPNRYFEFTLSLLHQMDLQLGRYLRGQFLDAVIFSIMTTVSLWLLGVKYYLLIAIFAGLANLIPFLGPVAGTAAALLVSLLDKGDFSAALPIVAAFVVMKLIDDILVQPLVVGKSVHMHPLLVLAALLAGGELFGILGMLLSVPATGFLKIVLRESISNFRRYRLA